MLTEKQAVNYLQEHNINVTLPMLRRYRQKGTWPIYYKSSVNGAIRYSTDDLREFAATVYTKILPDREATL